MEFFNKNKRYFITTAIGLVVTALLYFGRELPQIKDYNMVFYKLSEALFVPGVFIFSLGIMVVVANEGLFHGVTYSAQALWKALTDRKNPKMDESFYEYRTRKTGEPGRFGYMLIIGAVFILLSIAVAAMR